MSSEAELKGLISDLIKSLADMIKFIIPKTLVKDTLTKFYDKGLDEMENKFGINFTRNPKKIEFLEDYTFDNIKDMNEEMAAKLRKELSQGIMNLENFDQLKDRVQTVMDVSVNRAKMIARTETNRALNVAHKDAAIQIGAPMVKWCSVVVDARTSPICVAMNSKYGDEAKAIPMNEKFKVNVGGKAYEFDISPFHVNCRTRILYSVREDDE